MTYAEAIQYLYDLRMFGSKFGLENTLKLAALAGNPHQRLRFIHVAGTNGKGSTCAILESIYRASGLRTGLFTSPHLVSFAERIQVNRQLIPDTEVTRLTMEFRDLVAQLPGDQTPTFFEVVTVMALKYFAEQQCDLVIWETGLGGRLDATNIVTPLASVITNIAFDHQKWLGDTIEQIAGEKAGIIKASVPVITGATNPDALRVIEEAANNQNAPLTKVTSDDTKTELIENLPLLGDHQKENAAVALATVQALQKQFPVSAKQIETGLQSVYWPGRLQLFQIRQQQTIVLDGAHNVAGAESLAAALQKHFHHKKPALVLGILQDKDFSKMCSILAPLAREILLVPVQSERTTSPEGLLEICRRENPRALFAACDSVADALERLAEQRLVVITGSLYLVGEALELLTKPGASQISERKLNEWFAAPAISGACRI